MIQVKAPRQKIAGAAFLLSLPVLATATVPGLASADANSYLREAHATIAKNAGPTVSVTDAQALQLGRVACQKLRKEADGKTIPSSRADSDKAVAWEARRLGISSGEGLDRATIMWLTEAAEHELC